VAFQFSELPADLREVLTQFADLIAAHVVFIAEVVEHPVEVVTDPAGVLALSVRQGLAADQHQSCHCYCQGDSCFVHVCSFAETLPQSALTHPVGGSSRKPLAIFLRISTYEVGQQMLNSRNP